MRATRLGIASRYGRSEVIALYASAAARFAIYAECPQPRSRRGNPAIPPLMVMANDRRNVLKSSTSAKMRSPISECVSISRRSASVSAPGFSSRPAATDLANVVHESTDVSELLLLPRARALPRCRARRSPRRQSGPPCSGLSHPGRHKRPHEREIRASRRTFAWARSSVRRSCS